MTDRNAVEAGRLKDGIDGAFHLGHVTESEWLARRKLIALIEGVA